MGKVGKVREGREGEYNLRKTRYLRTWRVSGK